MRKVDVIGPAALALMLALPSAGAARQLLQDMGLDVRLDRDIQCDEPAELVIEAEQPGVFEAGGDRLQRVVDAARAMLAYECPDLEVMNIAGYLRGLSDPVYQATAREGGDWRVQVTSSIQSRTGADLPRQRGPRSGLTQGRADADAYAVTGLELGMSVDEAMATVRRNFGVEPQYDASGGIMTMQAAGCPGDFDWERMPRPPEPGWKCLQAWFTDERDPQLYRLQLIQVTETAATDRLEAMLVERYGSPAVRVTGWGPEAPDTLSRNGLLLGWGGTIPAGASRRMSGEVSRRLLEAVIEPVRDVAVTAVSLYEPSLGPQPEYGSVPERGPDLQL